MHIHNIRQMKLLPSWTLQSFSNPEMPILQAVAGVDVGLFSREEWTFSYRAFSEKVGLLYMNMTDSAQLEAIRKKFGRNASNWSLYVRGKFHRKLSSDGAVLRLLRRCVYFCRRTLPVGNLGPALARKPNPLSRADFTAFSCGMSILPNYYM